MKKILLPILAITLFITDADAQKLRKRYRFDYGFGLGASNYLGEMGGKDKPRRDFVADMKLSETRWAVNGFVRYKLNNHIGFQTGLTYLRIEGDDKLSTNRGRKGRNLNFRNDMLELSARTNIFLYGASDVGNRGKRLDFMSYAFVGMAGLLHSPKTTYNGEWVKLRPLMTEGKNYSKVTLAIPVGTGFYFTKKNKYRFGFERGWRISFTDYLDDVSGMYVDHTNSGNQMLIDLSNRRPELGSADNSVPTQTNYLPGSKRGDSSHNDTYFYTLITYSYVLKGRNTFYTQHWGWLEGNKGRKHVIVKF